MTWQLEVQGVGKTYRQRTGDTAVLDDISFRLAPGEAISLIGRSGCGKSTLLQLIAGLTPLSCGTIRHGPQGQAPGTGGTALMFQQPALLPWRTALSNVAYPLELLRVGRAEREARAQAALDGVGLSRLRDRYPAQLSGGQQQRVALARAMVTRPDLLLLDEPFASVDALTRSQLHEELQTQHALSGCAVILVTHSIDEALLLADRVLVMGAEPGRILGEVAVAPVRQAAGSAFEDSSAFSHLRRTLRQMLSASPTKHQEPDVGTHARVERP